MAELATVEQAAVWRRVIAEQERGDLTQGECCAKHGHEFDTFRSWKRRLARGEGQAGGALAAVVAACELPVLPV